MTATDPDDEVARLRAENAQLHDQVKLLVRTEQRLYRSQSQLDAQLARIEGLSQFALDCMHATEARQILASAAQLLDGVYGLQEVSALRLEAGRVVVRTRLVPEPGPTVIATIEGVSMTAVSAFIEQLDDPLLLTGDHPVGLALVGSVPGDATPLLLPLREEPERSCGVLVAVPASRFFRAAPGPSDLPFLRLLTGHLQRALTNVRVARHLALENRQLLQSLDEMSKLEAVGRLAGGVAHDFNNLLTVITSSAQLLSEVGPDGEGWREDVDEILGAARRASTLVGQLLTFSRQRPPQLAAVDLNQLVAGMGRMLRRLIRADIELRVELDPGVEAIHADPVQVEQVVLNLVINARDATGAGGRITLETRTLPDGGVSLVVRDTGHGMDAATRARVFQPFFTTKPVGVGTGMGLSTVYGIVSQHGGSIDVRSEPDAGAEFTVAFPAADVPLPEPRAPAPPSPSTLDGAGRTVLVVEDESRIRRVLERVLSSLGFQVMTAPDGEQALAVADAHPGQLDLVVTDLVMPNLDGTQLADALRRSHPSLRVLFMSGYPGERLSQYGLQVGSDDYLAKPFTREALVAHLARALADERDDGR